MAKSFKLKKGDKVKLERIKVKEEKPILEILSESPMTRAKIQKKLGMTTNGYWIIRNMVHQVLAVEDPKTRIIRLTKRGKLALKTGEYMGFRKLPAKHGRPTLREYALRDELLKRTWT